MSAPDSARPAGRVLQVSVSPGGVPKRPVPSAHVTRLGLEGDRHREDTLHGGPMRAVCLFSIEAIERLQAEGHPVEAGSVGENLTTTGIEWSTLPVGTLAQVGDDLLLELTTPANPCDTQRPNFTAGRINRISIKLFPSDSRMYARVLREGEVRPGDPITLLPVEPASDVIDQILMERIDAVERRADMAKWEAARQSGMDIRVLADGDLVAAAAPGHPDYIYNHADGLRMLPNLLPRVLDHYRRNGVVGGMPVTGPPWPGATPTRHMSVQAVAPERVPDAEAPAGVTISRLEPDEGARIAPVIGAVGPELGVDAQRWAALAPALVATRDVHAFIAESGKGHAVGCGLLYVHKRSGLLRTGIVLPEARGQGVQRALVAARARLATELEVGLLATHTLAGSVSERNMARMCLQPIWSYDIYQFDPRDDPVPQLTERPA